MKFPAPFVRPATDSDISKTSIDWAVTEYRRNMDREPTTLFLTIDDFETAKQIQKEFPTTANLNLWVMQGWPAESWSVGELMIFGWGSVGACG